MRSCNLLDNRQSHPSTRNVTRPSPAIETFEQSRLLLFRDRRVGVENGNLDRAVTSGGDSNGGCRRRIFDGVVEQLAKRQVEQIAVHVDQKIIRNLPDDG